MSISQLNSDKKYIKRLQYDQKEFLTLDQKPYFMLVNAIKWINFITRECSQKVNILVN
jgi:hypothetical protein